MLREATRRAGVVPNAAYRHFAGRDELLMAVRAAGLSALARAMEAELKKVRRVKDPAAHARAALRAVGVGYVEFAVAEPGWFRSALTMPGGDEARGDPARSGESGLNPFQLLGSALDQMVQAGALPKEKRPGAEYLAWSSVHGLAMLVIDGPLRAFTPAQTRVVGQRLLDMVEQGLE